MGSPVCRGAPATGLLVLPFALASMVTASASGWFSNRFGRMAVQAGITAMFAGLALVLLALHLGGRSAWDLTGPLILAGLGNGLVIAPNQDFVLGSVPRRQAGTAGGALATAQRLGSAVGIAVVGTALFGGGSLMHSAQRATTVNLAFVLAAWFFAFGLPKRLERTEETR